MALETILASAGKSQTFVLAALLIGLAGWGFVRLRPRVGSTSPPGLYRSEKTVHVKYGKGLPPIEPLQDFSWVTTEPLKWRPFKDTYHITMALQTATPSDLIIMDRNYLDRVNERRQITTEHDTIVFGITPEGHDAVAEVYSYLLEHYLPARYPTMFETSADGTEFTNKVTDSRWPLQAPPTIDALKILAETVEDDLLLLKPTEKGHRLVAYVNCYPAGFDPSKKLGKVMKDIHTPVPSYEKIGPSMERFFSRLEVGKCVKRVNWSLTTQPERYTPSGTHVYDEGAVQHDEKIDINEARLRVELQCLTRLPETQAILFSFKTYQYPITEIKEEGLGPKLADAIEGLQKGNAPGMWVYKGAVRWGKDVMQFLRS